MPIYERYVDGRRVPGSRQLPEPGKYDDTRLGLLCMERRETGARDGWYEDGEWAAAEEQRQHVADETVKGVLAEVGDGPVKARVALQAELSADAPRVTLVKALHAIVGPLDTDPAPVIKAQGSHAAGDRVTAEDIKAARAADTEG